MVVALLPSTCAGPARARSCYVAVSRRLCFESSNSHNSIKSQRLHQQLHVLLVELFRLASTPVARLELDADLAVAACGLCAKNDVRIELPSDLFLPLTL